MPININYRYVEAELDYLFGDADLIAMVYERGSVKPAYDELAAPCRTLLAGYKVPRALVLTEGIGRTNVGKADYTWAMAVAAQGT
ncbi:hypothetical protein OG216_35490 [Streptomycetaceae bacterium NBC_01309]